MIYCQQKYKNIRGKATVFATITDKNKQKKARFAHYRQQPTTALSAAYIFASSKGKKLPGDPRPTAHPDRQPTKGKDKAAR